MTVRIDPFAPPRRSRSARPGLLKRLTTTDTRRARRRRKDLDGRLRALRKAGRSGDLPSDHQAFLLLALGRLDALLDGLPPGVRDSDLTLSWIEGLLGPLERQAAALPPELAPFATRLPTTVEEEERRRQALNLLEAIGSRLRRERDEILASLDEVESGLS